MTSDKVKDKREAVVKYCTLIGCSDEIVRKIGEVFDLAENTDEVSTGQESENPKKNPKLEIKKMLSELAIPAGIAGYNNLTEAVYMVYKDKSLMRCVTTRIYPEIAKDYGGTKSAVERTIRHAIEIAWRDCPADKLKAFFGEVAFVNGRMMNKDVIAKLAERLGDIMGDTLDEECTRMMDEEYAKRCIRTMLSELAIPASISGYRCIEEAAYLIYTDEHLIHGVLYNLYPKIAKNLNIANSMMVERAIHHAIGMAWKNCPKDRLVKYFGETAVIKDSMNNKDFISKLAEKLHYYHTDADIVNSMAKTASDESTKKVETDSDRAVKQAIKSLLDNIAISSTISGYKYLAEAVYIVYTNPKSMKSFERFVYYEIAQKNGAEEANITRAIRHAVKSTQKRYSSLLFWKEFYDNNIAVTPKTVTAKLVEELRLKY